VIDKRLIRLDSCDVSCRNDTSDYLLVDVRHGFVYVVGDVVKGIVVSVGRCGAPA